MGGFPLRAELLQPFRCVDTEAAEKETTMSLSHRIESTEIENLFLDPSNPRLRLGRLEPSAPQEKVLEYMRSWSLEELAVSFLENGYWPQEAVIVVKEELYGAPSKFVVVEGNRRIAALKYLKRAMTGESVPRAWKRIVEGAKPDDNLFTEVPYILSDSREDVIAFLGFRHVTGIKQWAPAEKAEFIARLVDENSMSYESVRRQIGSRIDTVRRNYIAYRILEQIDELDIEVSEEGVDRRFSVLFLALREPGVQNFLGVDIKAKPRQARTPVPESKTSNLSDFVAWLFGSGGNGPLFTDSRNVGKFARILSSDRAIEYLRSLPDPSFDLALQKAGVEDEEIENQLKEANNQMELALSRVHLHLESEAIQKVMRRLALNAKELVSKFPGIAKETGLRWSANNDA
jgi:hypothetical protein